MPDHNQYDIGDVVRLSVVFTNTAGAAVDPDAVTSRIKNPAGTVTTPTVVKDSVGHYHVDVSVGVAGRWHFRFIGTGVNQAAEQGAFHVRADTTT